MDEKFENAIEEFITQRMDDIASDAPDEVSRAIAVMDKCADELVATLTDEQLTLYQALEDAMSEVIGEEMRYYYKAGLRDVVLFSKKWN